MGFLLHSPRPRPAARGPREVTQLSHRARVLEGSLRRGEGLRCLSLSSKRGIKKTYRTRFGGASVEALKNVNFTVEKGEYVAIMGESGSGKTTLLNIIAALDKPTEGTVILDGMKLSAVRDSPQEA